MRKSPKKGLLYKVILSAFAVYAVCTIVNLQVQINEREAEAGKSAAMLEDQKRINSGLEEVLKSDLNDEQIKDVARDKLGMVMPGERVYVNLND